MKGLSQLANLAQVWFERIRFEHSARSLCSLRPLRNVLILRALARAAH